MSSPQTLAVIPILIHNSPLLFNIAPHDKLSQQLTKFLDNKKTRIICGFFILIKKLST